MKKCILSFILFFSMAGHAFALTSQDLTQFEKANLAYREGKFDEASALYKALSERNPDQPAFYYNYGNALQRKGELGTAIIAYERALRTAPRSMDIRSNLNYVRSLLEYRVEDKRTEFTKLAEKGLSYFTMKELSLLGLLLTGLLLGSWAWTLFFKADTSWGILRKALIWLTLFSITACVLKAVQLNFFREAIVTVKEAQTYYGPSVTDQPAFKLGDGIKVYIVDDRQGWSRILIASGESGWIQQDAIAEVWPRTKS